MYDMPDLGPLQEIATTETPDYPICKAVLRRLSHEVRLLSNDGGAALGKEHVLLECLRDGGVSTGLLIYHNNWLRGTLWQVHAKMAPPDARFVTNG